MIETAERLNNQAILLAADGSYKEAIACFVRAITIEKDNSLLWYNLGLTYRDSGDLKDAEDSLLKAHYLSPFDSDIIEELTLIFYQEGKILEAMQFCTMGIFNNPESSRLWNTQGVLLFNQEDYNEASISFERAVVLNPYYYDALFNLRDTYAKIGNKAGEQECAKRLKELKKNGEPL